MRVEGGEGVFVAVLEEGKGVSEEARVVWECAGVKCTLFIEGFWGVFGVFPFRVLVLLWEEEGGEVETFETTEETVERSTASFSC